MRRVLSAAISLLLLGAAAHCGRAECTREFSVQVSATVQTSPPQVLLTWPQDTQMTPASYTIFRKAPEANSWGKGITIPGSVTVYNDTNVASGAAYEYQVVKATPDYTGYGYICAGIDVPPTENRGRLLLVVESTYAAELKNELAQLQQDLTGDGWLVTRMSVTRTDSVVTVKNLIKAQYTADPTHVNAVFLFGHVPVPYSGDIVPDGHMPDHQGAWPCDGYYGDMDGLWTDKTVNDLSAGEARTHNVPGDGKFDQSNFPAPLKLMVGRVDLANLPGRLRWGGEPTFPSELELLRNYLHKDHKFRTKQFDLPRRAIVGDYFGIRNGEAFAASGWRNFSAFFSATNITNLPDKGTWLPNLNTNNYLWAYGCGAGSFTSIAGLGNSDTYNDGTTTELMKSDVKAVFTLLFGSWLGDWDSEDDILRSVLALPSYGLAAAWSGRPHWFLHHMALGQPIGYSARLTQNNRPGGLYQNQLNSCAGQVHIALMGDPTLRMHVVAPPANLSVVTNQGFALNWSASPDSVEGYYVYGSLNPAGPFTRLTPKPLTCTSYSASNLPPQTCYMVRAIKLETSASGTYFNLSQGAFLNMSGAADGTLTAVGTNAPSASIAPASEHSPVPERPEAITNRWSGADVGVPLALTPTGISVAQSLATSTTNPAPHFATNAVHGANLLDYITLALPVIGSNALHILTPTLLELKFINTKQPDPAQVSQWNLVNSTGQLVAPAPGVFTVTADGVAIAVAAVGFKRRPIYAPLASYDLRIENSLYLQLASPVSDNQTVQVLNPNATLWPATTTFTAIADPLRYSPAIHVNQEGYMPGYTKKAMVGYYAGSFGEITVPSAGGFKLVDAATGAQVYQGTLTARPDAGWTYTPTPYQQVFEADFTAFDTPGAYQLVVPGMGASLPFMLDNGIAMDLARAYSLGLYHQRCGTNTAMPYTRFIHDVCHGAPASVPLPQSSYNFTWTTIAGYANSLNGNNPPQIAPALTSPSAQLFPYVNQGPLDVSGGHHDAGDYSKYTINSASLVHYLMFAVDSLAGVAALDNLGIPESGDGISDVMQEAKWEADFLAKMQDSDGGFYFLVYPQNREYEGDVTPDHGDPQVVWPKTTSVTAASVAALAQCASSPLFKQTYPAAAAVYLQKAQLGWQFLTNAIARYGKNGAYQKITHYGDNFADNDEMAWAACQIFLATGDASAHQKLLSWFDPADPATWRWGWWHMSECYGHAIRSYAFAVQSGRISSTNQLDATFLSKCQAQIAAAGDDALNWSGQSAYGTSFPSATKAVQGAGWYFSCDQAFDLAVAYQLNPKPAYLTAMLANMNYEGGCNPVNVAYVTGLGWKRQRDIVSQWALNDFRVLPPSGIPVGNITSAFGNLWWYGSELEELCFPSDTAANAPYPFYDRWGDSWNVTAEMVVLNEGRGLGMLAFLAAQTASKTQAWRSVAGQINVPPGVAPVGSPITLGFQAPGLDLTGARITWEARDQEPAFGPTFTLSPKNNGPQWVEAEAQLSDGRRVFAITNFTANSPNIVWVDDSVPLGGTASADGGDTWNWISGNPAPFLSSLSHQSVLVSGEHQHFFYGATATLALGTGDVLYCYVYLDPANTPSEVMLQWNDGTWEHRAYWGGNSLVYGTEGTPSRYYAGPLPPPGQWVQLKVPASAVNLEGSTLNGMAFTLYNGRASWDAAGRLSGTNSSIAVGVTASTPVASRLDLTPGVFTLTRSGSLSNSLSVSYLLSGTANLGSDYRVSPTNSIPGTITFPAGAATALLNVTPVQATNIAGARTVVLNISANSNYSAATNSSAAVTLTGDTVPLSGLALIGSGASLRWSSISNHTYAVAFKTNLIDPIWLPLTNIVAASNFSVWLDPAAATSHQRFYVIADLGPGSGALSGTVVPLTSVTYSTTGALLSWNSTINSTYTVAYKDSLNDSTWTVLTQVVAAANTISWIDLTAITNRQRFYIVKLAD